MQAIKAGGCDIVIGTHRLLSSDIQFKDLGLLIIDEEQRFGVRDKERLKHWRSQLDVLVSLGRCRMGEMLPRTKRYGVSVGKRS